MKDIRSKVMSLGNKLAKTMDRKSALIQAWATVKSTPVSPRVQKAIELFGPRWGEYTPTGFVHYELTAEAVNSILDYIRKWYLSNTASVFGQRDRAIGAFSCHVEMDRYPDYRLGYKSEIFINDVFTVLNTAEAAA